MIKFTPETSFRIMNPFWRTYLRQYWLEERNELHKTGSK